MRLKPGTFNVIVRETDTFTPDEQVKKKVKISDIDLFKIMNKQEGIEVPIIDKTYFIRFSKAIDEQ